MGFHARRIAGGAEHAAQLRAGGLIEAHVRDDPAAKKCGDAQARAVVKLVGDEEFERTQILAQRAHRTHGNHARHARELQRVKIGAIVDLRWQQPMASRVAREESDALAFERAEDERVGRLPEWRFHTPFMRALQAGHGVESAAPDNADFGHGGGGAFRVFRFWLRSHVSSFFVALRARAAGQSTTTGSATILPSCSRSLAAGVLPSWQKSASQPSRAICGSHFFLFSSVVSG